MKDPHIWFVDFMENPMNCGKIMGKSWDILLVSIGTEGIVLGICRNLSVTLW